MIVISDLVKSYGKSVQALRGIDLEIGAGMFGLVGPNGAGKTTLMRILAGLLPPTSGRVSVLGQDPTTPQGNRAVKSMLGYLPQELGLYPDLTALEFLEYMALLKGIHGRSERDGQIAGILQQVGLEGEEKRKLRTFSGGMKRRVGIAQALLGSPQLLIVDEPTAGLDPEERVRLRNLLAGMAGKCTVILSTHIVEDVSQSCSDLAVINQGKVLFHASPMALIESASGHVWQVTSDGVKPEAEVEIVSMVQTRQGMQYRLVGDPPSGMQKVALEPSLEDGYIWLMRQARAA
jgi:ABC-type multidrug transport system ATPase subunit